MKYTLLLTLLILPLLSFSQEMDKQEILTLNEQWLKSYASRDTATLSRIFADDFILVSPKGTKMSKQDVLTNLMAPNQETVSVHIDSAEVRLFGNTGLITATTTFILRINGKEIKGKNCYSDLYIKRNNKWVAVAAHVTLLNMQ
ncbi:nuclear transport factor 2 family protein [Chitinophaga tropicalis]|nr:nuclear transport factor 2 family protein [Chitinophaga tropicalis]